MQSDHIKVELHSVIYNEQSKQIDIRTISVEDIVKSEFITRNMLVRQGTLSPTQKKAAFVVVKMDGSDQTL